MKKILSVLLTIALTFTMLGAFTIGYAENFSLTMQIGSPIMTVNGTGKTIDDEGSGNAGTAKTIKSKLPNATVTDYLAVYGSVAQKNDTSMRNAIDAWLKKLGYIE